MEERKMIDAELLIDKICSATFTRHATLTEEEFLKEIKADESDSEDVAVIKARFSLIVACTKQLMKANETIKMINATLELCGGNENGKN